MRFIGTDKIRYDFPIVNPGHQDTAIPGFWVTLSGNPTGEMVQWHIDVAISSSDLETPRQSTITILGHRVSSRVAELTPL
jgi:hypothetical protein